MNEIKCPSCGGKTEKTQISGFGCNYTIFKCVGLCQFDSYSYQREKIIRESLAFTLSDSGTPLYPADKLSSEFSPAMPEIFSVA